LQPFPVNAGSVIFSVLMLLPFVDYDQGKSQISKVHGFSPVRITKTYL